MPAATADAVAGLGMGAYTKIGLALDPDRLPGPDLRIRPVEMEFDYGRAFGGEPPEAYERLILDALRGDARRHQQHNADQIGREAQAQFIIGTMNHGMGET